MGYVTNGFKLLTPVMLLSALEEVLYQYFRVGKVTVKCKEQTPYIMNPGITKFPI